jgi:hypothetical protein
VGIGLKCPLYREAIFGVLEVMEAQGKRPEENIQILDIAV